MLNGNSFLSLGEDAVDQVVVFSEPGVGVEYDIPCVFLRAPVEGRTDFAVVGYIIGDVCGAGRGYRADFDCLARRLFAELGIFDQRRRAGQATARAGHATAQSLVDAEEQVGLDVRYESFIKGESRWQTRLASTT